MSLGCQLVWVWGGAWWRVRAQFVTSGPQHTGHWHCGGLLADAGGPVPIVSPEKSTAGMLGFGVGGEGQELPNKPCREGCMGRMGVRCGSQKDTRVGRIKDTREVPGTYPQYHRQTRSPPGL